MRKVTMTVFILIIFATLVLILKDTVLAGSLPDTGQTRCYDDSQEITCPSPSEGFYGQDANYAPCNPQSYTKLDLNGNDLPDDAPWPWAMVRDDVTGLIWEVKESKDGTQNYNNPHDADNRYTWYDGSFGKPGTGTDTEDFINAHNSAQFGGYNDWRLPTIKELSLIIDSDIPEPGPTINTDYFPNTGLSFYYWSSNIFPWHESAWAVYFGNGGVGHSNANFTDYYYARAVRGGQSTNNFTDNLDGTVSDTSTGLMWQQATAPGTYDWEQALTYCENLILNNDGEWTSGTPNASGIKYDDWRLPNRNELQSIADYSTSNPSIDTSFFPTTFSYRYWQSTTLAGDPRYSMSIQFDYGGVTNFNNYYKSSTYYVRAVRIGQCGSFVDSDGDGIPDDEDDCPLEDSTGFDVDGDGCIDSISGLTTLVETLVDEGVIDEQMRNSLLSKMDNASQSADKENICTAVNQLEALINQVNAQRGKKISDDAADQVIAYTQSVIDWYLNQLPEGETCL